MEKNRDCYVLEETSINPCREQCLSFRGFSKKKVLAESESFANSLPNGALIKKDPIIRFCGKQYCIFVHYDPSKTK